VTKAKKILITTESRERFILRIRNNGRAIGHCGRCEKEVEMLTIDQAVSASGIKTSKLIQLIDSGEFHGIDTASGHLLICAPSLAPQIKTRRLK
jgi:hypothetical protein